MAKLSEELRGHAAEAEEGQADYLAWADRAAELERMLEQTIEGYKCCHKIRGRMREENDALRRKRDALQTECDEWRAKSERWLLDLHEHGRGRKR